MRKSISLLCIILSVGFLLLSGSVAFANNNIGEPTISKPDNNSIISENAPTFEWQTLENAENYRLVIDNNIDFADYNYYDNSNIQDNSFTLPSNNSLGNDNWYWQVRGENGDEVGVWSGIGQFRVDTVAPKSPSLISPGNDNVLTTLPNLKWSSVDDNSAPVEYKCRISEDQGFNSIDEDSGWIEENHYQIPDGALEGGEWYWKVKTKDNLGNESDYSKKYSFDYALPELREPIKGANENSSTVEFTWENETQADYFEIWVDNDQDFSSPENIENFEDNHCPFTLSDGRYYWRVRSFIDSENSHFSNVRTFLVDTQAPPAPSNSDQDGMVTSNSEITLSWESVTDNLKDVENSGIESYELWVDNESEFNPPREIEYNSPTSSVNLSLTEDNYYYQVRVWDKAGNKSEFSDTWEFRIDRTPPEIISPSVSVSGVSVDLEWETDEPSESEINYGIGDTDDNSKSDSSLKNEHSFTIENLAENTEYNYEITSTDNVGNENSISGTFTTEVLDIPVSSIDNLSSSGWYTGENVRITASAQDNRGYVENVELYYRYRENSDESWGSGSPFARDENSPWEWDFDKPEGDGHYQLYTRATDNEGKTEEAPSDGDVNLSFDGEPPNIKSAQINGENSVTTQPKVRISIEAEDATSGVDNMRYKYKGKWSSWEDFDNGFNLKLSYPNSRKTVSIQVRDEAGLVSTAENSIALENATFKSEVGPIGKGENKVANFSEENTPVQSIALVSENGTEDVEVSVRVQKNQPSEISKKCPENAKNYLEIKTNAGDGEISQAVINFKVEKSWLENRNIEAGHVKLWKLEESWGKVPVSIIDDNESHVFYSAEVSDFSWFAISGERPSGESGGILVQAIVVIVIVVVAVVLIYLYREGKLQEYLGKLREYIPSLPSSGDGGIPTK